MAANAIVDIFMVFPPKVTAALAFCVMPLTLKETHRRKIGCG
jgi:hypothetical protein